MVVCVAKWQFLIQFLKKESDTMDCAIICGGHPVNGYNFQLIRTNGEHAYPFSRRIKLTHEPEAAQENKPVQYCRNYCINNK
jgi:hypothetical protein